MTIDQIVRQLDALGQILWGAVSWLAKAARALAGHVTQDHLEGAGMMALFLLGPSLFIGLVHGFWQGLRIEWRQFRELPNVIDGDTIEIRGERVRLFAADAPEMGQPWWTADGEHRDAGQLARKALERLVEGRRLSVRVLREDQYRRSVAIVKVDGRDVARALVSQGWAFASPESKRYRRAQTSAKRGKKGLWQGDLQMPWDYRAAA